MKKSINWRSFFILLGFCALSIVLIFPYILTIQGDLLEKTGQPVGVLFLMQFVQTVILLSVMIFFGLFFLKKTGFTLPLIQAREMHHDPKSILKSILWRSVAIGAVTALVIYLADYLFTILGAGITTHANYAPAWQTLLAALYGGTTEEALMRLFLMSFFVWLSMKIFHRDKPTQTGIVISIFLAAIIFGLGHLPITASLVAITPLIVLRAIVLNGIGGIVFGWLFWKRGLESAMIAHFTADIFLLTLLPLVLG
jgi:membrane protease YdiL (CAAX protease family)